MKNEEKKEKYTVKFSETNNDVDDISLDLSYTNSQQKYTNTKLEEHVGKDKERFTSPPAS